MVILVARERAARRVRRSALESLVVEPERITERLGPGPGSELTAALGEQAAAARLETGELVLDRYRLRRRLGAGGFGVVWLAVDERLEREVAVKAVPREGLEAWRRAEREARAAARLGHPGIVALYELGADAERAFLVSEYVPGRTLAELLEGGAISDRDVARVGEAMCDALAHAHARGVVHRDVKPQNVMVVAEPAAGAGFAKLADFGSSRLAAEEALTRAGEVVGTVAYMSPEQADGLTPSGASDLYSLALTLYEGLTGSNPVRAPGLAETVRRVGRPLPALRRVRPDLPLELTAAIDRALAPEPERRGELEDLREGLAGTETGLSGAGGLEEPETLERFGLARRPRRPWLTELLAAAVARPGRNPARADPWARPRAEPSPGFRRGRAFLARLGAAGAAGALAALALAAVGAGRLPVEPALAAALSAVAVLFLPRLGWLAAAAVLLVWLGVGAPDQAGVALVLAVGVASVPVLLPRAGTLWSLPAGAAALGTLGLAAAFPALAGLVSGPLRRAALGAAGYLWLALAEVLTSERLLYGPPKGAGASATWGDSLLAATREPLDALVSGPVLLPALVWAAFAALLPVAVRGRSPGPDLLLGAVWGVGLFVALESIGRELSEWGLTAAPRGGLAGVLAGLLMVMAGRSLWRRMAPE